MHHEDSNVYNNDRTMTFTPIPTYQVHTMDPILFCVDTGAPMSSIRNKTFKRIVQCVGRRYISMIESDGQFKLGGIVIRSKRIVELFLSTPEYVQDIPILLDIVYVNVPTLLSLYVLDGTNLFVDNAFGHLWNRNITSTHP